MRSFCSLLISVGLAYAAPAAEAAPPAHVEIAYEVVREGTLIAGITHRFEHANGRYRAVETWKGRGFYSLAGHIVRSSYGTLSPSGPRPLEFVDERTRRSTSRARFNWDAGTVAMHRKGETQTRPLPTNAQDRLSFLLALAFSPPGRSPASFNVADGGTISNYVFDAIGVERINVPAGEFEALKVARRPEEPGDKRVTHLWLARSLGWLPVRILLVDRDGARFDQQAVSVSLP